MKKTILALMVTATIVACSKSDDKDDNNHTSGKFPTKITQITGNTRVERTFELQDATHPKKETQLNYTNGSLTEDKRIYEYEYDSSGRLFKKKFQLIAHLINYGDETVYHYRADGKLEKDVLHSGLQNNLFGTSYEYRADGKLIKKEYKSPTNLGLHIETEYVYPTDNIVRVTVKSYEQNDAGVKEEESSSWHTYTLDGKNNIVKDEYSDATYRYVIEKEYDSKINPEWADFFLKSNPDYFITTSRNNIIHEVTTKTEINNSAKVTKQIKKYKYQYNGDYPIKRTTYLVSTDDKGVETETEQSILEYSY